MRQRLSFMDVGPGVRLISRSFQATAAQSPVARKEGCACIMNLHLHATFNHGINPSRQTFVLALPHSWLAAALLLFCCGLYLSVVIYNRINGTMWCFLASGLKLSLYHAAVSDEWKTSKNATSKEISLSPYISSFRLRNPLYWVQMQWIVSCLMLFERRQRQYFCEIKQRALRSEKKRNDSRQNRANKTALLTSPLQQTGIRRPAANPDRR